MSVVRSGAMKQFSRLSYCSMLYILIQDSTLVLWMRDHCTRPITLYLTGRVGRKWRMKVPRRPPNKNKRRPFPCFSCRERTIPASVTDLCSLLLDLLSTSWPPPSPSAPVDVAHQPAHHSLRHHRTRYMYTTCTYLPDLPTVRY